MAHKLTYRPRAAEDLEAIYRIIAQDKPASALSFIEKSSGVAICCAILRNRAGRVLTFGPVYASFPLAGPWSSPIKSPTIRSKFSGSSTAGRITRPS
jgi:hypothetical protein